MAAKLDTLQDLFESELKDIYGAEQQIMEAMPEMIEAASSVELKEKLEHHSKQTEQQIVRLEEVFEMLDMEPEAEKCDGMAGILEDGEKMLKAEGEPHVKDAALVAAAQKVEHYEISTYGTLRTFAHTLGHEKVAEKLQQTLREESETDKLLTKLAEASINREAPGI